MTTTRHEPMKVGRIIAAIVMVSVLSACKDLIVPDYNNTSLDDLVPNPTPTKVAQAGQGLLVGTRVGVDAENGSVPLFGILGRESYTFDAADPRFLTKMVFGPHDGGSLAFDGNPFAAP